MTAGFAIFSGEAKSLVCSVGEECQREYSSQRCTPTFREIERMALGAAVLAVLLLAGVACPPRLAWIELICCSTVDQLPVRSQALM